MRCPASALCSVPSRRTDQPLPPRRPFDAAATNSPKAASPGKQRGKPWEERSSRAPPRSAAGALLDDLATSEADIRQLCAAAGLEAFPSLSSLGSSPQSASVPSAPSSGRPSTSGAGGSMRSAASGRGAGRAGGAAAAAAPRPAAAYAKPRRRADPVSSFQRMQEVWKKDKFLRAGGDSRIQRRKAEGFREMFGTLHALEAARR